MKDWWFDGDYSECYYAWNEHANEEEFAKWIFAQEDGVESILESDIEYLWVEEITNVHFKIVPEGTPGAIPITRYRPF